MIDPTIRRLLEQVVNSPVKLHLLLMFHEHSQMRATPSFVAERTCRDIWSVAEALGELATDGLLHCAQQFNGEPIYTYAPWLCYVEPIRLLLQGYDDPLERDLLQRSLREVFEYATLRRSTAEYQPTFV